MAAGADPKGTKRKKKGKRKNEGKGKGKGKGHVQRRLCRRSNVEGPSPLVSLVNYIKK